VDADQLVSAKQHRWNANARAIAERPTLIRRRLYRAIDRNIELPFIEVTEWKTGEAASEATHDSNWRTSVQRMLDDPSQHVLPRPATHAVGVELGPGADSRADSPRVLSLG